MEKRKGATKVQGDQALPQAGLRLRRVRPDALAHGSLKPALGPELFVTHLNTRTRPTYCKDDFVHRLFTKGNKYTEGQ